jgi:F-type H+-transporting ATPase subunit b
MYVLWKVAFPRIAEALDKRQKMIEDSIDSAERTKREEMMEQTRRDIEAETRRAIQEIRAEVADLTVLATEKVTRKSLDAADQRRLVEEALSELDFAALASEERN